ncbi:putative anaphase-promoting complex subunit 10 protein [Phaeoacremonium minimum UCRPA7]|uniref:Putative anaphase-promoting complex subunit 10 protein n=1 Tax=Phaeoacremonium minimum (strain UCR-PA7) TaxID=1286976 RepID=R8BBT7_PHAM7|nr:putative anaphase-promoting complex subunit 10 protein [Phaeoacremonium minimum UCRPA7]EON96747.1 putative anaphase-promoting complex subunit 10 protein [Phaeoacremonium minimum UCRPA7]
MSPAQDLQSRMMAAHDDVEEALNQAELAGQFPQPMFRSAFESHDDGESDLDNDNTFAFEGNSEDDEQFGFGAGSGDDMIEGLIDDPELIGGLTDGHDIEDEDHQVDLDQLPASIFDPAALGLKEINNLARFRVSTYKPGNGVQELLSDDLDKYWQ